jgi:hypothetical protein
MAVLNRCAVSVTARPPMRDWCRPFMKREDMESLGDEPSLYLIAPFEDEPGAHSELLQRWPQIFHSELELWCQDQRLWPQQRSFELFCAWFELRLFPLVEDLAPETLSTYEVKPELAAMVGEALRGSDPLPPLPPAV